jgi:hypothetical protein
MTDPIIFVDMHNFPRLRPKTSMGASVSQRRQSFRLYNLLQEGKITELAASTVFQKEKAHSTILCSDFLASVDARPSSVIREQWTHLDQ